MTKERKLDDPELKKVSGASGTPLSDSDVVPSGDGDAEQLTPAAGEDGCFGSPQNSLTPDTNDLTP
jgi:hypothetical protein